jgi:hypothetical protein
MRSRTQLAGKYGGGFKLIAPVPSDAEWLTPAQLAVLWQTTERTLRNWRAAGKGPPFVKHGNTIRYPRNSLNEFDKGIHGGLTDQHTEVISIEVVQTTRQQ